MDQGTSICAIQEKFNLSSRFLQIKGCRLECNIHPKAGRKTTSCGLMAEIIKSSCGDEMLNREGINSPDSQETNQRESMPFHKHTHVEPEVNEEVKEQIKGGNFVELFEEKLEEINRDLRKFDTATEIQPISNSSTSKENFLESMTLNEIFMRASQTCVTPLGSNRVPFSAIPDTLNTHTVTSATWKRQVRHNSGTDVIMEDAVGLKRSVHPTGGQPELQKKKESCFSGWQR